MSMMMRSALAALLAGGLSAPALASGGEVHVEDPSFSFEGPFGTYEPAQLQRGLQIYREVCASCHGLKFVPFRALEWHTGPALPEEQVKAIAAEYEYPREGAEDEFRPGQPFDTFPTPEYFGDGAPPDLSLIAKARAAFHGPEGLGINQLLFGTGGPEYVYSLMTGYHETPECAIDNEPGGYYNAAFGPGAYPESCIDEHGHRMVPGSWIAMPQQLSEGLVEYADGTEASEEQMAKDVAAFLMWAAEPKMVERKEAGLRNLLWLVVLAAMMYFVNKKVWKPIKGDH